ncbi:hypothetical protein pipiens_005358 [Culex pipiens pipiens]|uniref:Peptidase S1 domain-containing protein n=1 Tax=Culex pipiens pipiens TaxID=38569 RepID=A0ABD1DXF3_CULPP
MNLFSLGLLLCCSLAVWADDTRFSDTNARFRCGIRKKSGVQLIHQGRTAELGQWPWHVALFHGADYKCGGTLIDQLHVLTSAHCVIGPNRRAMRPDTITIQVGKNVLDENPDRVQIVRVREIHVHPDFMRNRNDIALLVLSQSVQYSEFVIPICIEGIQAAKGEDLVGQRGWVAGFGETETEKFSRQLKTASMPVVNNTECVQSDPELFGRFVSPAVFCGSDKNGTSVCRGDSGGGMYILAGDHWELRGITSFSGLSETGTCDVKKYVVFTNVAFYYEWIKQKTGGTAVVIPKRISESKCREYSRFAAKRQNGVCYNSRSPHTVAIIDLNQRHISSGSIISESMVFKFQHLVSDVVWDDLWVRLGNQPDKKVIREISHPDYDPETLRHHIMLLEMDSPLAFSNRLVPVCLANLGTENLYDTLLLNGYSGQSANTNEFYESVENRIISNEKCNETVKIAHAKYTVNEEELCAMDRYEGFFFWGGIVGGPLQTVNTRSCMFTQVGVTKFLIPHNMNREVTKTVRFTNVYSRVTAYLDWIEAEVWGNETLPEDSEFADNGGEAPTIVDNDVEGDQEVATEARLRGITTSGDIIHFPKD